MTLNKLTQIVDLKAPILDFLATLEILKFMMTSAMGLKI